MIDQFVLVLLLLLYFYHALVSKIAICIYLPLTKLNIVYEIKNVHKFKYKKHGCPYIQVYNAPIHSGKNKF